MRYTYLYLLMGLAVLGLTATPAAAQRADTTTAESRPHVLRWSAGELALAGTFATGMWIDAAQTRDAMRRGYYESNPLLRAIGGDVPSATEINLYGLAMTGASLTTAAMLPRPWRAIFLSVATAVQMRVILRSVTHLGIAIQF